MCDFLKEFWTGKNYHRVPYIVSIMLVILWSIIYGLRFTIFDVVSQDHVGMSLILWILVLTTAGLLMLLDSIHDKEDADYSVIWGYVWLGVEFILLLVLIMLTPYMSGPVRIIV